MKKQANPNKLDELLYSQLHNLQKEPDKQDWAQIQHKLGRKERRSGFFAPGKILFLAMAALLVIGAASIFLWRNFSRNTNHKIAETNSVTEKNHISPAKKMVAENKSNPGKASSTTEKIIAEPNYAVEGKSNTKSSLGSNYNNKNIQTPPKPQPFANPILEETLPESETSQLSTTNNIEDHTIQPEEEENKKLEIVKEKTSSKQKTTAPIAMPKKFLIGFSFAPEFTNSLTQTAAGKEGQVHKNYFSTAAGQTTQAGGINTGIFLQYNIWKGLNIQSGIRYNRRTENVHYNYTNNQVPVIDSATGNILAYIETNDSARTNYYGKNTYTYAAIPFLVGYEVALNKKISLALRAGGSALILLGATGQTLRSDDLTLQELNPQDLKKFNWAVNVAPAIFYNLNSSVSIGIEPYWQYFLQPAEKETTAVKSTFSSAGIGFSVRFSPF